MLIPMEILKKYVDINVSDQEFVKDFSLKSAEVDTFKPFCDIKGLVIGKIVKIENHPDSNHLHITTINFGDHEEDNGVDLHRYVILCDNVLRREINYLLLHVYLYSCESRDYASWWRNKKSRY